MAEQAPLASPPPDAGPVAADVEPDDEPALLARAQAGDTAAFALLVARHQSRVRQQLRRLCDGDAALADDLAQDSFVQAWQMLPGFRGEARLATWLHRVAYTRFLMHRRTQRSRPAGDADALDALAAPEPSPALRLDLAGAMAALPEAERVALLHCAVLELTHDEAAQVLGWPLGTLKSHVARGKARLRTLLAPWQAEAAA